MNDGLKKFINNNIGKPEEEWITKSINIPVDFSFRIETGINDTLNIEVYLNEVKLKQDINAYIEKYIREKE